ncbi:MAG: hypothetical protein ABIY35_04490, partial [Chitinophagaceae bacterium]
LFHLVFFNCVCGQINYSNLDFTLKTIPQKNGIDIFGIASSLSVKFTLGEQSIKLQGNIILVDSQPIQIIPIAISDLKKSLLNLDIDEQQQLLNDYSKYEIDYFSNKLGIEVLNKQSQWVDTKSRYWFIWYFQVGNVSAKVDKKAVIQLFATTVIDDKILVLNAPIMQNSNFVKMALIVNQMMESLIISPEK